jgi:hypothetical protein
MRRNKNSGKKKWIDAMMRLRRQVGFQGLRGGGSINSKKAAQCLAERLSFSKTPSARPERG